jgi:cytochrome c-type biogenesis protein CcmF
MIPELGHFALCAAVAVALSQAILPLLGTLRDDARLAAFARRAALAQGLCIATAFGCLATSFAGNDFSVLYVTANSNSKLPLPYRIAATWGGHEGSLLLWVLMLALWSAAVALFSRRLPDAMVSRVLAVMGLVTVGFLLFLLLTSNPFERMVPPAADGRDLNPLLQDPGMVSHPPLLYMGYVGFSVAFAFAIAALWAGRLDATWARWSRPWTILAWAFLTLGIMLGSAWAYYELGWGGWWFWDPVENASLMPWLVGTALLHSLAVTDKRGAFRNWTVLLAILAFSLSLLGTFLVRSGIVTSVHAFASDPRRGIFILVFLALVVGGSLALFAWRAPKTATGAAFGLVSRESMLLTNNVLLMVAAASVLLGTLYPLLLEALQLGKISVGPPYFESVMVPLLASTVFLMGIGPLASWRRAALPNLALRLRWAFAVSLASALLAPLALGGWSAPASFGLLLAFWLLASQMTHLMERLRHARGSPAERLRAQSRSYFGMLLAHLGVAVFIVGVTLVNGYQTGEDVRLAPGEKVQLGRYTFQFEGVTPATGPNFRSTVGRVRVLEGERELHVMRPEKRFYTVQRMPMTEAAIAPGLAGDLYISLVEPAGRGAWSMRIQHKPFVDWIWGGCGLMALGGLLAASDRRYRIGALLRRESAATVTARDGSMRPAKATA